MERVSAALEPFAPKHTALLSTRRRDGSEAASPVSLVVDGDHAYFRTWSTAWKARRMRRDPAVRIAPSTLRGRPTGPQVEGHVRLLDGDDERRARDLLARRYRVLHGLLVPAYHRLRGLRTQHYELVPR
jgi:PPOX class probable F420-dependent enzyme